MSLIQPEVDLLHSVVKKRSDSKQKFNPHVRAYMELAETIKPGS
jgi:hypothetical protein